MSRGLNLTGQRFGRLVVIERVDNYVSPKGQKQRRWRCECDCGNICIVRTERLRTGETKSCGCFDKERKQTHGKSGNRIYAIWKGMKSRCLNHKNKGYENYGGREITVCEEWMNFEPFYEWAIAHGYRDDLSIDRIDNDKGYCPENCRWVSNKNQQNNKRNNHLVAFNGKTHTIAEWAEITGINKSTIRMRLKNGWSVERALTEK